MPEHRLPEGLALIAFLQRLGDVLGYQAVTEHPLDRQHLSGQAIDVAWFRDEGQTFPLMVFEVESRPSRGMGANVAKVFAKETTRFEKPLFFFHLLLEGGSRSEMVEDLRKQYGSYNYRLYRLAENDPCVVVKDIMSQHRRLTKALDIPGLTEVLATEDTYGCLDSVLMHIEQLGFSGTFGLTYARRALTERHFLAHFDRVLLRWWTTNDQERDGLDIPKYLQPRLAWAGEWVLDPPPTWPSYLGAVFGGAIELALLADRYPDPSRRWMTKLAGWLESSGIKLASIRGTLGQSQDYDDFVLGMAGHLLAVIAALTRATDRKPALECLSGNLGVLEDLQSPVVTFPTAVWLAHVAAASGDDERFAQARSHINSRGGISEPFLYEPPRAVSVTTGDEEWPDQLQTEPVEVPGRREFVEAVETRIEVEGSRGDPILEGLNVLLFNSYLESSSVPLLAALHHPDR